MIKQSISEQFDGPGGMTALLRIAAPMISSAGADTLMMFTDRYFVSELGKEHLAATMSGSLWGHLLPDDPQAAELPHQPQLAVWCLQRGV